MGKNSRKNKMWAAQIRAENKGNVDESSSDGKSELKDKLKAKTKTRENIKRLQQVDNEMKSLYYEEFGHSPEDISKNEASPDEHVVNFLKNIKFWELYIDEIEGKDKTTAYEKAKLEYCIQMKDSIMGQLGVFPPRYQEQIRKELGLD